MTITNVLLGLAIISPVILLIVFFVCVGVAKKIINIKQREMLFKNYSDIMDIFSSSRETAYQKIFRENVMAYATSGYKVDPDIVPKLQNEYVSIVLTYCGPSIKEDLINIHGDFDSIVAFLASDLMVRIENDESALINIKQQGTPPIGMDNGEQ